MADRILFVGWGKVVRGREERALAVFNGSIGFYGRCQQDGRIEKFDVVLLDFHGGTLNGYAELHGSPQQLATLREDDEFQRLMSDANFIVDDLRVVEGHTEQGLARRIALFSDAMAKVPQAVG